MVRQIAAETGQILNLGQTALVHQKQVQSIKLIKRSQYRNSKEQQMSRTDRFASYKLRRPTNRIMGSHSANPCQNLFTLRWKSVIAGLCLVRPHVFPFGKNFAKRRNIKDAVVLGWGRQILEKSSQTMGITAATVNACQRYMENDTRGKFNSSSRSLIMNGHDGVVFFFGPMLTHEFPK